MPRNAKAGSGGLAVLVILLLAAGGATFFLMGRGAPPRIANTGAPGAPGPKGVSVDDAVDAVKKLVANSDWPRAEALLRESIALFPEEQALRVLMAQVHTAQARDAEAYEQYEKALAIGPREGELEFAAGTSANAAGKPERAAEHYAAAQAQLRTDWKPPLYLAQVQMKLGRYDEAKKNLLMAVHLKQDLAIAWGSLAEVALRENAAETALRHVQHARLIEPESVVWRLVEARALKRLAKPNEALALFVGLSDEQKLEPGVLRLMGECLGMMQRPDEAAILYTRFADKLPERGDLAYEAALWLERAGDKARAKQYAERAKFLNVDGAAELLARVGH
ncbi:MAG TPA: tetratricopeptide repeat protein [Phycisphaerales bacterium]|nr:tetratricopeptide repeat protein [Phycisphaerales bacterium]